MQQRLFLIYGEIIMEEVIMLSRIYIYDFCESFSIKYLLPEIWMYIFIIFS